MITYLLDTNICIYIIKQKPIEVFECFQMLDMGLIGISSITAAELQYGVHKSSFPEKNDAALREFLIPLEILPFNSEATIPYGKIKTQLERAGRTIGPLDTLIGAHAISLDATLVTNNLKEFSRIEGLKTENWIV